MEKLPCTDHGQQLVMLDTQLNGVEGKGGVVGEIEKLRERVDSLHTKFTFGIGFITAIQLLMPFIYSNVTKAITYLVNK